ncbi:MAG: BrnT family toxin [Verrucomicrobiae bacterium]|nr:BrnT family toxin [Verrucomicrobiae bacterium]
MEFDWTAPPFDVRSGPSIREIEESFEDPYGLRLLPDSARFARESRAFCLGKTLSGKGIFSVFWTDGKRIRVLGAREMTPEEEYFYERKVQEWTW